MTTYTISDIKAFNRAAGWNYFAPETMRFFRSRTENGTYAGAKHVYFVTSEQFVSSDGIADARKYSVRRFDPSDGRCDTAGEFNTIGTLAEARAIAKRLARTE